MRPEIEGTFPHVAEAIKDAYALRPVSSTNVQQIVLHYDAALRGAYAVIAEKDRIIGAIKMTLHDMGRLVSTT
jgi:hypothetical protein